MITLTAVNELIYNRFEINKVLIIAPKKVAEATWNNEAQKWDHLKNLRISNVVGSGQTRRIRALYRNADIYVINRENVPWLVDYYRNSWPFDMVVIDEASSFKSHQAKRFKSLSSVRPHIKRMVQLTGTPAPNSMQDLWAQIYLMDAGERLEKNITGFRTKYFDQYSMGQIGFSKYKIKPDAESVIHEKLKDIVISMKSEDYLQLPDMVTDVIPVVLDTKADKVYQDMERKMILETETAEITVTSAAALSNKLCQLCNGAVYDENRNIHEVHDNKLEAFREVIEKLNGAHALVFYNFRHDIPRIKKILAGMKKPDGTKYIVEELKGNEVQEAWNRGEIDIMLTHPASAAYGLNLQDGGNHTVWFGLNWSLELYQQANKRLHRQGQKYTVVNHILAVENGRDMDVLTALETKEKGQEYLLESLKARIEKVKRE